MTFSTRVYSPGDRVVFCAQVNGVNPDGDVSSDPPYFGAQPYVLVEGYVSHLQNGMFPGRTISSPTTQFAIQYTDVAQRVMTTTRFLTEDVLRECIGRLTTNRVPEAQREFLMPFMLPVVVADAGYMKLLRDLTRITHPDRTLENLQVSDVDDIRRRAEGLGIRFDAWNPTIPVRNSVMHPAFVSVLRRWENDGWPTSPYGEDEEGQDGPDYDDDDDDGEEEEV